MKRPGGISKNAIWTQARGSILIFVLWVLALTSLLTGQYLLHNREEGAVIKTAWRYHEDEAVVESVIELFSQSYFNSLPQVKELDGSWFSLSVGSRLVWVKWDSESKRININTASEIQIRDKLMESFSDAGDIDIDEIADAIMDWLDEDDFTRAHGAEAEVYKAEGVRYVPANGPFKVLTELLLVRGVTRELFWGDPYYEILQRLGSEHEGETELSEKKIPSIVESFTIYGKDVKRLSIILPGSEDTYNLRLVFFKKKGNEWQPFMSFGAEFLRVHKS